MPKNCNNVSTSFCCEPQTQSENRYRWQIQKEQTELTVAQELQLPLGDDQGAGGGEGGDVAASTYEQTDQALSLRVVRQLPAQLVLDKAKVLR